ncbi:zinc-binding dehydrogenase [Nocardiopsis oceani]
MSHPKSSRTALLEKFGEPVGVVSVDVPQKLEPRAILVRVLMASICGTDVHTWLGEAFTANEKNLPSVMGHEMVGEIVAFGEGEQVDSLGQSISVGDRILWTHAPCATCFYCTVEREPSLCLNRKSYGRLRVHDYPYLTGGFAEYCYVFPGSGRVRVPDEVPDSWATAASCALRTPIHLLEAIGEISPEQSVVVQGTGPLGLYAVALLNYRGISNMIVTGAPDSRLKIARDYGARDTVSVESTPVAGQRIRYVRELTPGGVGADVVLEMSGAPTALTEGLGMIGPGGRYGIAGQTTPGSAEIDPSVFVRKQIKVVGSLSAHIGHYWRALEFLRLSKGRYDWDSMLSDPVGLGEATSAMDSMRQGVMKPLVDPQK